MATFYNQATLSYTGGTVNSNITVGELVEAVSVTKTAVESSYAPDGTVTYVVSLVNTGAAAATGVTVTDDLGAYAFETQTLYPLSYVDGSVLFYVDGALQPAPVVSAGPPLVISGLSIPAGGSAALVYQANVTRFAPMGEGAAVTNTVTVTGGGIAEALTASAAVPAETQPRLSISKALDPEVVSDNSRVTYTFVIQNAGGAAGAEAAIVITDTFDPVLTDLTVELNGQAMSPTSYTYSETTGTFATVSGAVTVPAAAFTQGSDGSWDTAPGVTVFTVTGTI